jgi:hypothetical protein
VETYYRWGFELRIGLIRDSGVLHAEAVGPFLGSRLACHRVRVGPMLWRWSCLDIDVLLQSEEKS